MKKVIYTAIIDNYDIPSRPLVVNEDYDYILFTNNNIDSDFWKVINVIGSGAKLARKIKIRPDIYLNDYDMSIWLDANIIQNCDINKLTRSINDVDMITMQHPSRICIYEEVKACLYLMKDDFEAMAKQTKRYKDEGYPVNNGLIASGILIRWHNLNVKKLMKDWDNEVQNNSHRDQLSFNYCKEKSDIKLGLIPYSVLRTHFKYVQHK